MKKLSLNFAILSGLILLFPLYTVSQTYNDGPIELQVKVKEVKVVVSQDSDFNIQLGPFTPGGVETDEYTFKVWARGNQDVGALGWQGGQCLTDEFNPTATPNSVDFNTTIFTNTYGTATVPQFFDLRIEAFEDEMPSDFDQFGGGLPGIADNLCRTVDGFNRCDFNTQTCCASFIFVGCLLDQEDDDLCDANPFSTGLDYRQGISAPPCATFDHGFIAGSGCANNNYQPHIETYWRYTKGTACNITDAIDLGTLTAGSTITHFNSNECYSDNYAGSPGNDVTYTFQINTPLGVDISVCGVTTTFDTYLYLLDSSCTVDTFNDDGCGTQSIITKSICNTGRYYVVVDGKTAGDFGTFTLSVAENPSITFAANLVGQDESCFQDGIDDGEAWVEVTGGLPAYTFMWSGGNPVATNDTIKDLASGNTYTVTVTDQEGCTTSSSVLISEPSQLVATADSIDESCGGAGDGQAAANPSGGTPTPGGFYNYEWDAFTGGQTGRVAVALSGGTYTVTVTDVNGCTTETSTTINSKTTIIVKEDSRIDVSCFGFDDGSIAVSADSGITPYRFVWSNGETTSGVANLPPGNYVVTVFDSIDCFEALDFEIQEPTPLLITGFNLDDPECFAGNDGAVDVDIEGGTPPYGYQWSNANTLSVIFNVNAGQYGVTVTDDNDCVDSSSTNLVDPVEITTTIDTTLFGCYGAADLTVSGGTLPYSYLWSDFTTTEDADSLPAGPYSIIVTDASGCLKIDTIFIEATRSDCFRSGGDNLGIPNAFTPNGDGNNDFFDINAVDTETLEVRIFNRWGEEVFYKSNQTPNSQGQGWNGTINGEDAPTGTYVYVINIDFEDDRESVQETGTITLLR